MALHVGTSGWAYPEWRGALYPPRLPQGDFLSHYSRELGACEVNATFYRLQPASVLERWAAAVPPTFRFTVKAHRRVTYRKRLAPDAGTAAFVREFVDSLAPLGDALGCLLVQLPEFSERDDDALWALLDLLPPGLPVACEFLHPSWWSPDVLDALAERGGTVCVREEQGASLAALPPGPVAYVRLKGEHYSDQARQALRELFEREAASRDVYVFARHKDVPADDPHTGLGLARWLTAAAGDAARDVKPAG
jgi:uncharacterized protein YecE (DUF72 family)